MISPGCTEERNMNIGYSINSIIIYYLTWKSLDKKASISCTLYPAFIMYCLRNVIRILDVEKTRERMTAVEWQDLEFLYLNSFYLMVVYFFLAFLHNKSSLLITCLLISTANTFVKYNQNII